MNFKLRQLPGKFGTLVVVTALQLVPVAAILSSQPSSPPGQFKQGFFPQTALVGHVSSASRALSCTFSSYLTFVLQLGGTKLDTLFSASLTNAK